MNHYAIAVARAGQIANQGASIQKIKRLISQDVWVALIVLLFVRVMVLSFHMHIRN